MDPPHSRNVGEALPTGTNPLQPESPPRIPEHHLIRPIGHGSYGRVWLARTTMGMYRAVKTVFRSSFDNQRPFERELHGIQKFEPVSRLHEGFVDVLQVGINEAEGYFYYIMELGDDQVSGQDIRPESYLPRTLASDISKHGRLRLDECLRLGLAVSHALADLHRHNLVHRDIKPSNILFVNGTPKLADIGLVAAVKDSPSYVGTEGFIPPEGPGTPAADLYGLGKVLYEASTGRDRHDFPELPTEWSQSSEYQGLLELNEVILHCCNRDPIKRYASARDMHADLLVVLNGKSVKRLRMLERRFANLRKVAGLTAGVLAIAAAISYPIFREWRVASDTRRRQVTANVSYGNRAVDSGDLLSALPYFAEALRLDRGDRGHEAGHRLRFASVMAQCPKLTHLWLASKQINDACFSPDGKSVLFAEYYGKAEIHEVESGRLHMGSFGPQYGLHSVNYSPDGRLVVTSSQSQAAILWDAASLQKLVEFPHSNMVFRANFSPDSRRIVTACLDGQARVWDARSHQLLLTLGPHSNGVAFASYSHDGQVIATASYGGGVQLWRATNGKPSGRVLRHTTWVTFLGFSPDDQRLIAACHDHKGHVWDLSTGKKIFPELAHDDAVVSSEFSPDGRMILTASFDGTARLWGATDLLPLASNPIIRHAERLCRAAFSPDGRQIITACIDGSVRVWDLAGAALAPVPECRSFCRDGRRDLMVKSNELQILDGLTDKTLGAPIPAPGNIEKAELSRDGRFVLSTCMVQDAAQQTRRRLEVWNATTGEKIGPGISVPAPATCVALSDDGEYVVVYGGDIAQVWQVKSGNTFSAPLSHRGPVKLALFSPRADLVVTASGTNVYVWEIPTGRSPRSTLGHTTTVVYAEFSGDGKYLASCCADPGFTKCFAQVWNVQTGQPFGNRLKHGDGVLSASFSPDGRRVATASEDFTARVWETAKGTQIGLPLRHHGQVRAVAFSPNGRWVATASVDKTVRVWDPGSSDPLTPPLRGLTSPAAVKFLPDGSRLVITDKRGLTLLWQLPIENRSVTELSELAEFLSGGQSISEEIASGRPLRRLDIQWERLRTKYPRDFVTSRREIERWHEIQAEEGEQQEDCLAVVFHLERLVALRPGDPALRERLAQAKAQLKKGI